MDHLSSGQVAEVLGVPPHRLDYLTRDRQVRPSKGPTGAFAWTYHNVVKVAELLELPSPSRQEFRELACTPHGSSLRKEVRR